MIRYVMNTTFSPGETRAIYAELFQANTSGLKFSNKTFPYEVDITNVSENMYRVYRNPLPVRNVTS